VEVTRVIAGETIQLQMIYQKRRTLSMRFLKDVLVIKLPIGSSPKLLEAWLVKKEAWILKAKQASLLKELAEHQHYLFNQVVKVKFSEGKKLSYTLEEGVLWIAHPKRLSQTTALKSIRKQMAKAYILPIFEKACQDTGLRPSSIVLKDLKRSWGRCSSKKDITLSQRLIECDPQFIYYVAVHELIHLRELNHSPRFWALVKQTVPNLAHVKTLTPYHVRASL